MEIKFENVSFIYHGKCLLNGANVLCKSGDITTILGDSTSSIEILFSLFLGKIRPTKGTIFAGGETLFQDSSLKIGYIRKNAEAYLPMKKVGEILSFSSDTKDQEKISVLKSVGLDASYIDLSTSSLSRGEKIKLVLASFLLQDFDILLIDDPFFRFTEDEKKDIARILRGIRPSKIILFGTRDTVMAQLVSDFIYVTSQNRILTGGEPSLILTDRKLLEKARMSMPPILDFMDIVKQEKQMKMIYRSDINDLMKDIYRSVK